MITIKNKEFGISSLTLRILGLLVTALSYTGMLLGKPYTWMQYTGWFAFTIFAFLLVEGINHSSDYVLYYRRFIIFTVISEPLYDLFRFGKFWSPLYQSAMVTLLIGLIAIGILKFLDTKLNNLVVSILVCVFLGLGGFYLCRFVNCEYGGLGFLIILAFYIASRVRYDKLLEFIVMVYMAFFIENATAIINIKIFGIQYGLTEQIYCLLALIVIWLYNGQRGANSLVLRIALYCAYPIILAVFYILRLSGI